MHRNNAAKNANSGKITDPLCQSIFNLAWSRFDQYIRIDNQEAIHQYVLFVIR